MIEGTETRDGNTIRYIWKPTTSLQNISPIVQVYGFCFTKEGKVCVIRNPRFGKVSQQGGFTPWNLPGGTPESKETPEETLAREVDEEIDCDITDIQLLGAQEVFFPNNPDKKRGKHFFQLRYFAIIKKIKTQTPDPHDGEMVVRKFILPKELTQYIKWGKPGEAQIKAAIDKYSNWKTDNL